MIIHRYIIIYHFKIKLFFIFCAGFVLFRKDGLIQVEAFQATYLIILVKNVNLFKMTSLRTNSTSVIYFGSICHVYNQISGFIVFKKQLSAKPPPPPRFIISKFIIYT